MGEHGEFSKFSNFDVATRVPFILRAPSLSKKTVVIEEVVELVDLFPTLIDVTNISKPLKKCKKENVILCTEGKSLMPLIVSKLRNMKTFEFESLAFNQYPRPGIYPTLKPNSDKPRLNDIKIMGYSIRTDRYRYTEWIEFDSANFRGNWSNVYDRELYDHHIDTNETLNLVDRPQMNYTIQMLRDKLIKLSAM